MEARPPRPPWARRAPRAVLPNNPEAAKQSLEQRLDTLKKALETVNSLADDGEKIKALDSALRSPILATPEPPLGRGTITVTEDEADRGQAIEKDPVFKKAVERLREALKSS
jgi:hypothetical protein